MHSFPTRSTSNLKKIRIVLTANDVIHSWMIPAFGVKQDAIPGFVRDTWFKAEKIGTYRGQCAELCGKDHAFMPIVVNVVSEIGRAHVCTPVTNAHLGCLLLLEQKKTHSKS